MKLLKTTIRVDAYKFFVGIVFDEISNEKYYSILEKSFKGIFMNENILKVSPVLFGNSFWYIEEYSSCRILRSLKSGFILKPHNHEFEEF